jgi:hypothetical protein
MPLSYHLFQECGIIAFLVLDVCYLAAWLFGERVNRPMSLAIWEALLIIMHLVLGALALWFDNNAAYNIITFVCWGPIFVAPLTRKTRDKQEAPVADEEPIKADAKEADSEPKSAGIEESVSDQGEDGASQEEPPAGRQGRKGRRRRGQTRS